MSDPLFRAVAGAVTLLYLAAALFIPLAAIDALYLPDDTYYTLTIARNIAAGLGPSTDGVIQTTGFQPLIAMLLQPVFWLGLDGDAALRAAIVLSALFGAGAVLVSGAIVRQATGSARAATLALALAAVSGPVFVNAMNGLETTLAGLLGVTLIYLASGTTAGHGPRRFVLLGVVAGLALWARIDAALLILVLLPVAIWRLGPRPVLIVGGVAALTVSPWVAYCLAQTGSPLPESGGAVRQIVAFYEAIGRETHQDITKMGEIIGEGLLPAFPDSVMVWGGVILFGPLLRALVIRRVDGPAILSLTVLVMMAFYVFYLPAFWFFHRYLFLGALAVVVAVVVTLWPVLRLGRGVPAFLLALGIGGQHVVMRAADVAVWAGQSDRFVEGHKYGDVAQMLVPLLPDGAVVVAMQSGALSWYAGERLRVVNLDGVVNGDARQAIHDGTLDLYVRDLGAQYFADWEFNRVWLNERSTAEVQMSEVARYEDHQREGLHFTLYTLD